MIKVSLTRFVAVLFMFFGPVKISQAQDPKYPSEITVSKDGTANYKTIQEAVNAVRDLGEKEVKIYVKNGVYAEKVIIPSWKTRITLIGESKDNTIITNSDYSGKPIPAGKDGFGKDKFTTYNSYTLLIQANDVKLMNLTIVNASGRVGQAVAMHVEGDRFMALNCALLGNQDTLYAATEKSRQFYKNCFIEGTTDFIFGSATVVFQDCTIKSLSDSYLTAASTSKNQPFGFVFLNCKLIADSAVSKAYLGRPWRPYAKTVFLRCDLGKHIVPAGWNSWKGDLMFPEKEKTTFYAEYQNTGAGATTQNRLPWTKQLTERENKKYTIKNILGGTDFWNPLISE